MSAFIKPSAPEFASGPFSWVFFFVDRSGPSTYTYRNNRVSEAGTKVNGLHSHGDFNRVYISTKFLFHNLERFI